MLLITNDVVKKKTQKTRLKKMTRNKILKKRGIQMFMQRRKVFIP